MRISNKLVPYEWSQKSLDELRQELDEFITKGFAIPHEPGGWWHQYVCPTHHTELLYDPLDDDARQFHCPYGCVLEGEEYRGAWLVFRHQGLARYMLQAAAVYAGCGEKQYAQLSKDILIRYAEQYPRFSIHPDAQPWMLKGRAFHQALTEGVWATTLFRGFLLLQDLGIVLDDQEQQCFEAFARMMGHSMEEYRDIMIIERNNPENNYTAWLNAALSCVYAVLGEKEKLNLLIHSEGGLLHHLTIGVKPDHFEFEGSVYYHIFVLRAYLITVEMAERFNIQLEEATGEQGQTFEGMLDVVVALADNMGGLPALHDSPYERTPYAREVAEVFEIGLTRYANKSYVPILADAYRQLYGNRERRGLEALLFGEGIWDMEATLSERKSLILPDSGFAVLRHLDHDMSALIDFGDHGGSHGHYDKLHLTLYLEQGAISPERGVVPYGSDLRKQWFSQTASHNTVSVDGQLQCEHKGEYMRFQESAEGAYLWTRSTEAYNDCVMNRHLFLGDLGLIDWFNASSQEERTFDWRMHVLGQLGAVEPAQWGMYSESSESHDELSLNEDGSSWISINMKSAQNEEPLQLRLHSEYNIPVYITILRLENSACYMIDSPGLSIDPTARMEGIWHQQKARRASFVTIYHKKPLSCHWEDNPLSEGKFLIINHEGKRSRYSVSNDDGLVQEFI